MPLRDVVTVLRSGGEYKPCHVQALAEQVERWSGRKLVCLSDVEVEGVECRPLQTDWPRWWPKLEVFREFDSALYLDLDTVIVGPLGAILDTSHTFTALADFYRPSLLGSGLMAWEGDYSALYRAFKPEYMPSFSRFPNLGDQAWIGRRVGKYDRWQDKFPGMVVSYKAHRCDRGVPKGASIVCFHGKPKPWEVSGEWMTK